MYRLILSLLTLACLTTLGACKQSSDSEWTGGDAGGLNYTQYPINWVRITDENGRLLGGLGKFNGLEEEEVGRYYTGSGNECCTSYPRHWKAGMTFTIRWERERCGQFAKPNDCGKYVYQADVPVQPYSPDTDDLFVQFLPGDKVRVFINSSRYQDDQKKKYPDEKQKIPGLSDAEDGFTGQGVLDETATAERQKGFDARMAQKAAEEAAEARLTPAERKARDEEIRKKNEYTEDVNRGREALSSCLGKLAQSGISVTDEIRPTVCHDARAYCKKMLRLPPDSDDIRCR